MERYAIYILVVLLAVGSISAVAYSRGQSAAKNTCALVRAASIERATSQAREIALQDAEVSAGFEVTRTRIQTIYRDKAVEITHEIPPASSQCSLTPAGVVLLNRAITGQPSTSPANPGQPYKSMRPPDSNSGRDVPGSGHEIGGIERKVL